MLAGVSAAAQGLASLTVEQLQERLAVAAAVDGEFVSDMPSKTFAVFREFAARATKQQLVAASDSQSGVLRVYAVRGLVENEHRETLVQVLGEHLHDTQKLEMRQGCSRYEHRVGDAMFDLARSTLSAAQQLELGERLVREKSKLYAREDALRRLRFGDTMLHTIRKLAKAGDAPAAIALARYGIDKDAPILVQHLQRPEPFDQNCQFLAAEIHRGPGVLQALIAVESFAHERIGRDNPSRLRFWLRAITAHRNAEAAAFLVRFVRAASIPKTNEFKRNDFKKTVREAVKANADPVFDDVLTAVDQLR